MAIRLEDLLAHGKAALVLTEVQEGVVGAAAPWPALSEAAARVDLVGNAARLAQAARAASAPVIHCTAETLPNRFGHNRNARLFGSARKLDTAQAMADGGSDPHPAVWQAGDITLPRLHGLSAMTGSPLDPLLRNAGIGTVVIAGVSLSFGVLSLVMDAVNRGYQVIVPRDAVAGFPEAYAAQVMDNTIVMLATIAAAAEIAAAWQTA